MLTLKPQRLERLGNFLSTTRGHYIFLALSPLVVLLLNKYWLYPKGELDPWIYYGYFWDYPLYASRFFPDTYYGTRLPWILPGYLIIHLVPYMLGTFVFVLSVYYVAVFTFYSFISRLFNRHVALFAALLMSTDFYFLRSVSWYYVDGGVVVYLIFALFFLLLTCRNSGRRYPFMAGWAATSMVLCHFLSLALVPGLFGYLVYASKSAPHWRNRGYRVIGFAAVGAVCCLGFFDLVNFPITGAFVFFMPQVRVLVATSHIVTTYDRPLSYWGPMARWCIIPLLSVLSGAVLVLMYIRSRRVFQGVQALALFSSLGTLLILLPLQFAGMLYLQYSNYMSFFIPLCCLIMSGALYMVTRGQPFPAYLIGPFMFLAYILRSLTNYTAGGFFRQLQGPRGWSVLSLAASGGQKIGATGSYFAFAVAMLLTAAVLLPLPWKGWRMRSCLFLLGLAACTMTVGDDVYRGPNSIWELRQEAHMHIRSAAKGRLPRLWYNVKNATTPQLLIYRSLGSMYLWEYSVVNEEFPSEEKSVRPLRGGDLLVILSETPEVTQQVRESLNTRLLRWNQTSAQRVARNGESFWIVIGDVTALPRPSRIPKVLSEKN